MVESQVVDRSQEVYGMYDMCSMYSVLFDHGVHTVYGLCEMYGVHGAHRT
jgi:hypothetical protein